MSKDYHSIYGLRVCVRWDIRIETWLDKSSWVLHTSPDHLCCILFHQYISTEEICSSMDFYLLNLPFWWDMKEANSGDCPTTYIMLSREIHCIMMIFLFLCKIWLQYLTLKHSMLMTKTSPWDWASLLCVFSLSLAWYIRLSEDGLCVLPILLLRLDLCKTWDVQHEPKSISIKLECQCIVRHIRLHNCEKLSTTTTIQIVWFCSAKNIITKAWFT